MDDQFLSASLWTVISIYLLLHSWLAFCENFACLTCAKNMAMLNQIKDCLTIVEWGLYIDSWYISVSERTDLLRYAIRYLDGNQMNRKIGMLASERIESTKVRVLILSNLLYCRFTWAFSLMIGSTGQYHSLVVMMLSWVSTERQLPRNSLSKQLWLVNLKYRC